MTIKVHERLLLTGAAGGLGQALRDRLKANCGTLRLSDRLDFGADGYYGLDNSQARHIGYAPRDSADVFRQAIYARTPAPDLNDPAVQHQGGGFVRMGPFE